MAGALLSLAAIPAIAADLCSGSGTTTINSVQNVADNCVLDAGGSLAIQSSGKIVYNNNQSVLLSNNIAGNVVNQGTIAASRTGLRLWNAATLTGGINNSGLIEVNNNFGSAGIRVNHSLVTGGIINSGNIRLQTTESSQAAALLSQASVTGGITNSGLITASGQERTDGIYIYQSTVTGNIVNESTGTISGTGSSEGFGIGFEGSTLNGSIINRGLIKGAKSSASSGYGIEIYNSSLSGGITNSGTILGDTTGILVNSNSRLADIVNLAGGTISGASKFGLALQHASLSGSITNSGSIEGGQIGISVNTSTISGGITNLSGGTISGVNAGIFSLSSTISGNITNSGNIIAVNSTNAANGLELNASTVLGSIVNTGTVVGQAAVDGHGISLSHASISGGIVNGGYVRGDSTNGIGLYVDNSTIGGSINNQGTISGVLYGVETAHSEIAGFTNSGRIEGLGRTEPSSVIGRAVAFGQGSTINGGILNQQSGTIVSQASGIRFYQATVASGGIINNGYIEGSSALKFGQSTVNGGIVNSGTLSGNGWAGIGVSSGSHIDSIVNTGKILAASTSNTASAAALYVDSNAVVGSVTNSGLIAGNYFGLSLANSANHFAIENSGTISGPSNNIGINTLNLNGASSRVIGNTTGTGTTNVNGTFSSEGTFDVGTFNIHNGGLFNMANGVTVGGGNFNNAGVLNVGATEQTITGNYNQAADGIYRMGLTNTTSNYGKLIVTGTANLEEGAVVDVRVSPSATGITNGTRVAGVIQSSVMTATPANIAVTDNNLFYDFTAIRDVNNLDLIIAADNHALTHVASTYNNPAAQGVAGALDTMFANGVPAGMQPVFDRLGGLTPQQANNALSQMLPVLVGATAQATNNSLHSMNRVIQSRIDSYKGLSSGDGIAADKFMWMRGFGNWSDQGNLNNVSGFSSETGGFVIGADAPLMEKLRMGFGLTYARSHVKSKSTVAPNTVEVDTFELVNYGSYNLDPYTDINYQLDFGANMNNANRTIGFTGSRANGQFNSYAGHSGVGIGRLVPLSTATNVTPSLRLDFSQIATEAYNEQGAGALNLRMKDSTYRELLLIGDAKLAHQLTDEIKLVTNASAGYDFFNQQAKSTAAFTGGGPIFVTNGMEVSPWLYRVGAGMIHQGKDGLELSVRYDAEGRSTDYLNQTVSARARWAF